MILGFNVRVISQFNGPQLERQGVTHVVSFMGLPHDGPLLVFGKRSSTKEVQDQRAGAPAQARPTTAIG